jgi:hypothetical protein
MLVRGFFHVCVAAGLPRDILAERSDWQRQKKPA